MRRCGPPRPRTAPERRPNGRSVTLSPPTPPSSLDRVERLAVKVTRWVRADPGTSRRAVGRRLSAASYPLLDEAIDHAIATGRIIERPEPSHTGDDKRALYVAGDEP